MSRASRRSRAMLAAREGLHPQTVPTRARRAGQSLWQAGQALRRAGRGPGGRDQTELLGRPATGGDRPGARRGPPGALGGATERLRPSARLSQGSCQAEPPSRPVREPKRRLWNWAGCPTELGGIGARASRVGSLHVAVAGRAPSPDPRWKHSAVRLQTARTCEIAPKGDSSPCNLLLTHGDPRPDCRASSGGPSRVGEPGSHFSSSPCQSAPAPTVRGA